MGYVEGKTVADLATTGLSDQQRNMLVNEIAKSFATLHRFGWIHGDAHWRNMIVDRLGSVKLVDRQMSTRQQYKGLHLEGQQQQDYIFDIVKLFERTINRIRPPGVSRGEWVTRFMSSYISELRNSSARPIDQKRIKVAEEATDYLHLRSDEPGIQQ